MWCRSIIPSLIEIHQIVWELLETNGWTCSFRFFWKTPNIFRILDNFSRNQRCFGVPKNFGEKMAKKKHTYLSYARLRFRFLQVVTSGEQKVNWQSLLYRTKPVGRKIRLTSNVKLFLCLIKHNNIVFNGQCERGVKLVTHLHQFPRLRMRGAISPPPHMFAWRSE
jgi:hypothetical protein